MKCSNAAVFVSHFLLVYCQGSNDKNCRTPNDEAALCIPVYNCGPLLETIGLSKRTQEVTLFIQQSQCGSENSVPQVCCGSVGFPNGTNTRMLQDLQRDPNAPASNATLPGRTVCGLQPLQSQILGGSDTELDEFTWMARLEYQQFGSSVGYHCGGTLINNRYVLTAAHCVEGRIKTVGDLFRVRLGEYDTRTDEDCVFQGEYKYCAPPHVDVDVETVIVHPLFRATKVRAFDIALLRLAETITFSDFISPICLPLEGETSPPGSWMAVCGWGGTLTSNSSPVKQKVNLPIVAREPCNKIYSNLANTILGNSQICAGGRPKEDTCIGDSGGPLMRHIPGTRNWYQEGIISYGYQCGIEGVPGVYTKVSYFLDWIQSTLRP